MTPLFPYQVSHETLLLCSFLCRTCVDLEGRGDERPSPPNNSVLSFGKTVLFRCTVQSLTFFLYSVFSLEAQLSFCLSPLHSFCVTSLPVLRLTVLEGSNLSTF